MEATFAAESMSAAEFEREFAAAARAGYLMARQMGRRADEASDVVQDAAERAWRYRHSLNGSFKPWFLGIVHRTALRPPRRWVALPETWEPTVDPVLLGGDPDVRQAIATLPHRQAVALWLRYGEDLAIEDVAIALRIGPAAAKQLLFRARKRLKEVLEDGTIG